MKSNLFIVVAFLLCFSSCNNPPDGKETNQQSTDSLATPATGENNAEALSPDVVQILDSICEESGADNFIVSEATADSMIASFATNFRTTTNDALTPNVWIDACLIDSLDRFLQTGGKHDGLWIYNIAHDKKDGSDPGQRLDYESSVLLIPSVRVNDTTHALDLASKFPDCADTNTTYKYHRLSKAKKEKMIKAFNKWHRKATNESDHRTAQKDSLSVGMWVDKCVIHALARLLQTGSLHLDGVRIHSAAYYPPYTPMKPRGRFRTYQSTFVLVVTNADAAHSDNWDIIGRYRKLKHLPPGGGGFNHGDLCPTNCP